MSRNKLSRYYKRKIIICFALELPASQTTKLPKLNRNAVNRYYRIIRECIAAYQDRLTHNFSGEVELDKSYFGGSHKGNIGRSTKSKIPIFGILKRNGIVYTQIVPDVSARTLKGIIKQRVSKNSTIYSDSWKSYDGLVFYGYVPLSGIVLIIIKVLLIQTEIISTVSRRKPSLREKLLVLKKNKLLKYFGFCPEYFYLYLKEYEFRFNHRKDDIEQLIITIVCVCRNKRFI